MKLLNGKKVADAILKDIASKIKAKKIKPGLAVVLIGKDEASKIYVKIKNKKAEEIGITFSLLLFDEKYSEKKIIEKIKELNNDKKINGIIVQLPLPKKFNTQKIINTIDPKKDVDGFHPKNVRLFLKGGGEVFPVFPRAILKLIEASKIKLGSKKAIVIANSKLFGAIMIEALRRKKIKGKYILKKDISENLNKMKKADILITAVGLREIINGGMLRKDMIVIDGGIIKEKEKIFGDVDFDSVKKIAGFVTPVPGGVGPVTVACLLENVLLAFENQN